MVLGQVGCLHIASAQTTIYQLLEGQSASWMSTPSTVDVIFAKAGLAGLEKGC